MDEPVILITGALTGIGRATAVAFAKKGAKVHRASQPEEIAELIAFLVSPRASYVTGTTVAADGGRRAI